MSNTYKSETYVAARTWLEESAVEYVANPKGGKSKDRYAAYEKAATIGESLRLGSKPEDLLYDWQHRLLKVSGPFREAPLDFFAVKDFSALSYTDVVLSRYTRVADTSQDSEDNERVEQQVKEALQKHRSQMQRLRKLQFADKFGIDADVLGNKGFWETPEMYARRAIANAQAKDILALATSEGRKISDFEVLSALRLWDFRQNVTRQNVMREGETFVYSDTVGIVADRTGHLLAKEETRNHPEFARLLNRWLRERIPDDLGAKFVFTSININKNYAGRLHRDGNNVGPSMIRALGEFTGGKLNYYPNDDRSDKLEQLSEKVEKRIKLNIDAGLALFDGKRAHEVDPFEGERYSLVFFTCPRFWKIPEETLELLHSCEFIVPTQEQIDKLKGVLKPAGSCDTTTGAGAFGFWPHDGADRLALEAQATKYWSESGTMRKVIDEKTVADAKRKGEEKRAEKGIEWCFNACSKLGPALPARPELAFKVGGTVVDACEALNAGQNAIPSAIAEAGFCTVLSKRSKMYYVVWRNGCRLQALTAFGLAKAVAAEASGAEAATAVPKPAWKAAPKAKSKAKAKATADAAVAASAQKATSEATATGAADVSSPPVAAPAAGVTPPRVKRGVAGGEAAAASAVKRPRAEVAATTGQRSLLQLFGGKAASA